MWGGYVLTILWFQSLSGLTLGLNFEFENSLAMYQLLFQSLSGLTLCLNRLAHQWSRGGILFQSLSGLTLCLNDSGEFSQWSRIEGFNPFQG